MTPQHNRPPLRNQWPFTASLPHPHPRPALHVHAHDDPQRGRVESYIHERYHHRFGARVKHWMPNLVSLQVDGEILAAAGFRSAQEPLYLERYLHAPIEQYLRHVEMPVARGLIVETGQFAASRPGAGRLLVPHLAQHLHRQGFEWAVSTLTAELHHLFSRMGLKHHPLAAAQAALLDAADQQDWGTYYQHDPQVFAGKLSLILARFQEVRS